MIRAGDHVPATLVGLLDEAAARYGERPALSIKRDDGSTLAWSYRELAHRSRLAAWRLRSRGLQPGDRLLTWSPSTPELPATYFGAMRAGLILVPLDLRMAPEAAHRISERSEAKQLVIGTGRDAPDPADADLDQLPIMTTAELCADPGAGFPADWEDQVRRWPLPSPDDIYLLIYTSGTTGTPKGVMLTHGNTTAGVASYLRLIPRMEHRIVSLMPLSHLFEQAVGLYYALEVGADIRYLRSLNPRVIFETIREHRMTSMITAPQLLDLFWSAIEREVEKSGQAAAFGRLRRIARHLPMGLRRLLFRRVHEQFGGGLRLFVSAGAFLPPALQQSWEDLGIVVLQGYGTTETGSGTCTTPEDHGLGTVGRAAPGIEMRIVEDSEIQFRGPSVTSGYWEDPDATRAAFTDDGWYRTGDLGRLDDRGRLVLHGRKKDIIVLPNGFNVFPEDIENALQIAGIRDSVVLETEPGRIEAIVLAPGAPGVPAGGRSRSLASAFRTEDEDPSLTQQRIAAAVKAANATLAAYARIAAWRFWPDEDFPRTHTLKVKRNEVRRWAVVSAPLPVNEESAGEGGDGAAPSVSSDGARARIHRRRKTGAR